MKGRAQGLVGDCNKERDGEKTDDVRFQAGRIYKEK